MSEALRLEARGLVKRYQGVEGPIEVLCGVDLDVQAGEAVAVVGASGVGKSTLLQVLGGLDSPDEGSVRICGNEPGRGKSASDWRARHVGFVFQYHHLLPEFSALENVTFPYWIQGRDPAGAPRKLLRSVGLEGRMGHIPSRLSGGEQQRVAIARAVVSGPDLVLADEPTGNLDPATGARVFEILRELQAQDGFALVVATHAQRMAARCDRVYRLEEGTLRQLDAQDTRQYFSGAMHSEDDGTII
jgi:predicted ABC-type transport system involved in lysophospholipase L1 biosynthesis ATPase subunit